MSLDRSGEFAAIPVPTDKDSVQGVFSAIQTWVPRLRQINLDTVAAAAYLASFYVNVKDHGALGDGSTDDTAALNVAYATAKAESRPLWLPPGIYPFSSTLVWDGYVSVLGAGRGNSSLGTILKKNGNFVGIKIGNGSGFGETLYRDFVLDSFGGTDASTGIEVNVGGAHGLVMQSVTVRNQGSHGINLLYAAMDYFENLSIINNGGVGLRLSPVGAAFVNANTFNNIDIRQSGSHGLHIADGGGGAYSNQFHGLVCQNNTGYGVRVDTLTNYIVCYIESNTGGDMFLDTTATRNYLAVLNSSETNPAVIDNGTDNMVFDFSTGRFGTPNGISRPIPGTNSIGRDLSVSGGTAGAGGSAFAGGRLGLYGGSAAGTGNASGGVATLAGGAKVGSSVNGHVELQYDSAAGIAVNGQTIPGVSVAMDFQSVTRVPLLPRLTTTERTALTAVNGMIIYNTTAGKVQVYESDAWASVV